MSEQIRKVLHLGSVTDGRVFVEVEYRDGRLSMSGVIGPKVNGNATGPCGQIRESISGELDLMSFAPGWDRERVAALLEVWDGWHLNDMQAGTPVQTAWVRAHADEFPGYPVAHYEWACDGLAAAGLHPDPETGYRYGSAWLSVEVPASVLEQVAAWPATDVKYPWARV